MNAAWFEFLPDLNHFLSQDRRDGVFLYTFSERQTVKHLVEAAGVPHTEVGRVLVNSQPVDWSYQVQSGDRLQILPAAAATDDISGEHRFVADNHLGRLAAYLRMLGFDVLYQNNFEDSELAEIAWQQERILLTRDRRLLMRSVVRWGYCLRSLDSHQQLDEVVRRFDLAEKIAPFRRCLRCNGALHPVSKEAVLDQLETLTRQYYHEFHHCPSCGQVYWKGSHFEQMQKIIAGLSGSSSQADKPEPQWKR
jgi:uncharacterized protein